MSIVILGDSFTFPEGNAATNHAYTYAKGFIENGKSVHVICLENEYLENYDGINDGVKYYHPFGQVKRSNSFFVRRWVKFRKYIKTLVLLRKINREEKIIVINLWTYRLKTQVFTWILAKSLKTKVIIERSEHPLRDYKRNSFDLFYGNLRLGLEMKLVHGIFCMTNYLINFYENRGFDQDKLFLVPSTVDTTRFNGNFRSKFPFKYILYCGSLTILKDGVDILVESFARISYKHPLINLLLIGKGDLPEEELKIRKIVENLSLKDKIHFLGQLPRTEIPGFLCNAEILALARPKSLVADAGFPSKLTEYLATGKPVVVTKVGEIPFFLKDMENAFLSESDNVDDFAGKLDFVLSNYDLAKRVGQKGKELTATTFNYNFQAKRMISFIESLAGG